MGKGYKENIGNQIERVDNLERTIFLSHSNAVQKKLSSVFDNIWFNFTIYQRNY